MPVLKIDEGQRRARLAVRHGLHPDHRAADAVDAARRVVCLHATDPATVYLSAWARVGGFAVGDLDRALYADRTLVKHLCMRRTLFALPRELLGTVQTAAADRVAAAERRRLVRDVEKAGLYADGGAWLDAAGDAVLAALPAGRQASMAELREQVPALEGSLTYAEGKKWGGAVPVGPRVLTVLSAEGRILRATNAGGWTTSRPRWASARTWLGGPVERVDEPAASARLVAAWLRAFGPGSVSDIRWWLGGTLAAVRSALADLGAVQAELTGAAGGGPAGRPDTGWVLPDDTDPVAAPGPWAALLPGLDPTPMGWAGREWHLGPHKPRVFDTNGNAGPTAWWNGRIVGGWTQDAAGAVVLQPLEDVGAAGRRALAAEADRLTAFLGGTVVRPRFPSPLAKCAPPKTQT